jgi:hypothetical protein
MHSEIVCPFCQARRPLMGTAEVLFRLQEYGGFDVTRCPCGAVGFTSPTIDDPSWNVRPVKEVLCRLELRAEPDDCDVDMNYITHTEPPRLMLWAKRRTPPSRRPEKESEP